MKITQVKMSIGLPYPKSEQTIVKHNYQYKGLHYVNNRGVVNEYELYEGKKALNKMVKYYKGRLLAEYELVSN